ncbi:MAG: hypothetical protein ACREAE_04860 [Nitrosopumilaceae archaeon]
MTQKLQIIWIDDNPEEREKSAKNLQRALGAKVNFVNVKGTKLRIKLKEILELPKPDLIIIDHILDNLDMTDGGVIRRGSTAGEVIRQEWLNCPIIGVTGAILIKNVDLHKKSIYESLYRIEDFSKHYKTIESLAKSFRILESKKLRDVKGLIRLLKVPENDIPRLLTILPEELKTNYNDKSLPISVSRWVRHTLMEKPGFLYNSLWTATLLGIKEKSFEKVKTLFKEAKYDGLFADESNERWWQTGIREILYKKVSSKELKNTRILGRRLPRINKKDHSVCYACKGDAPETVGYTDEKADRPVQLHLRCSIPHPKFERSLYFEEIRMMKGAE